MSVRVSVVLRRIVCGDIDWRFHNLSGSHHQSQGIRTSFHQRYVIGGERRSRASHSRWIMFQTCGCTEQWKQEWSLIASRSRLTKWSPGLKPFTASSTNVSGVTKRSLLFLFERKCLTNILCLAFRNMTQLWLLLRQMFLTKVMPFSELAV